MQITKDMTIGDVVRSHPQAPEVLMQFGLGCVFCPGAQAETLEEGAMAHGLKLDDLLVELNKLFE